MIFEIFPFLIMCNFICLVDFTFMPLLRQREPGKFKKLLDFLFAFKEAFLLYLSRSKNIIKIFSCESQELFVGISLTIKVLSLNFSQVSLR
jgi:hypothetical protein